ncbi:hypothetical protein EDEG_01224 [Edhazardia aedis USNM 41457]|uniref:Uncharacterized protein n=1 Tax=Edhazardia aedis (strain USNM 41457) TaxID=1003232 RepID=J9DPV4_EDHAE|nr:hypothetical protein EDEG_01224 [Edhazardia aedis USNM 41457]|eukprot:EJW04575.1 hypothetical protein EDEG_01224 [Edhazardia aedis USNM 41457]
MRKHFFNPNLRNSYYEGDIERQNKKIMRKCRSEVNTSNIKNSKDESTQRLRRDEQEIEFLMLGSNPSNQDSSAVFNDIVEQNSSNLSSGMLIFLGFYISFMSVVTLLGFTFYGEKIRQFETFFSVFLCCLCCLLSLITAFLLILKPSCLLINVRYCKYSVVGIFYFAACILYGTMFWLLQYAKKYAGIYEGL